MPFLIEPVHLARAARLCMRRSSAPGADGVTWAGYRQDMNASLAVLASRLRNGTWTPGPVREITITSYTGKAFRAVVPTVEDRIVHRAMRLAVDPVLDQVVLRDWVSGYRPGRSRVTALRQAVTWLAAGRRWLADVDVAGASAGGDADELVGWLAAHVTDGSFLRVLRTALAGLPSPLVPGSGLWPVLFHLRLAQADALLDGVPVIRFADNYVAFTANHDEAVRARHAIGSALAAIGLGEHPGKSRIRPPYQANAEDLFLIDG